MPSMEVRPSAYKSALSTQELAKGQFSLSMTGRWAEQINVYHVEAKY